MENKLVKERLQENVHVRVVFNRHGERSVEYMAISTIIILSVVELIICYKNNKEY